MKPIGSDAALDDNKDAREVELTAKNKSRRGVPLPASDFPTKVAGYREPTDPTTIYNKLPHFFASSWNFVSGEVAEVLRQFDFAGGLYAVDVFQEDRITKVPGEYFHLNIGAAKNALIPEKSPGVGDPYGIGVLLFNAPLKDDDIALNDVALSGPDIWVDPSLSGAIFFSDQLWSATKAAKVHTPFRAKRCRIISN
jgi:hypothetical protein